jgi:hypothetical protein
VEVIAAFAVGVAFLATLLFIAARSAITLCVARVEKGKLVVVRGGLSARARNDIEAVVSRAKIKRATIRLVRAKDHARVEARGLSKDQLQRIRNVVGTMSLAQLRGDSRKRV